MHIRRRLKKTYQILILVDSLLMLMKHLLKNKAVAAVVISLLLAMMILLKNLPIQKRDIEFQQFLRTVQRFQVQDINLKVLLDLV